MLFRKPDHLRRATNIRRATTKSITAGNHHGPATATSVPSHTSRYFSVNLGLTHLVALSLNGYNGVDTCTTRCNDAQLQWLKQDLAAVDRSQTPWVGSPSLLPV